MELLQPFAVMTDVLQTDSSSLANVLPSILDLECHLLQHPRHKVLTTAMLRDLRSRFQPILQPDTSEFNPLPAAACLMDPQLSAILLSPELLPLLNATKAFIVSLGGEPSGAQTTGPAADNTTSTALGRFKFLAAKLQSRAALSSSGGTDSNETLVGQLSRYLAESAGTQDTAPAAEFWLNRVSSYSLLAPIALDLITAPASQAFVERIFSLCGMLSTGRRNRMSRSLEMRVFLKLNTCL